MLEVNVVNKLPDNKVLVSEKNSNKQKQTVRYYIANGENADKFIKERKNLNNIDNMQGAFSVGLSAIAGLFVLTSMKSNVVIKTLGGIAAGLGAYLGLHKIDSVVDKQAQKNSLNKFKVEEITGNQERIAEAINYKPESEVKPEKAEDTNTESELEPEKEVETEKEPEEKPAAEEDKD